LGAERAAHMTDDTIRFFFNKETGQFLQLGGQLIERPFSPAWVEIEYAAFMYLLNLLNTSNFWKSEDNG
jgi:hypothetical protein